MANNRLILRTLTSPWVSPTDLTKNSVLSHEDVDNNFIYLRGEAIKSAGFSSGNVVLTKVNGETITVPTGAGANTFVTGGTYDANTSIITLSRNDNVSINIGGLTDTVVTAFTYDNANSITLSQNQGEPDQVVLINTMSGLTVTGTLTANTIDASNILSGGTNLNDIFATTIAAASGDTYVTGFTYDNANNITLSQNEGQADKIVNISTMTGLTVTGTISGTTVLADNILSGGTNITNIFQTISGASSANTYVTGFTYDNSNNITLSQTNGEPDQVVTIDTVSGLTVNGTLTATTINAGDILSGGTNLNDIFQTLASVTQVNLATDDLVQDAEPRSYNMNNNNLTFSNGYFTVTDSTFGDIVNLNHSGGELFFGGASGVGTGGSNFIHDTKFNVASSTTNCHRDFLNNVGLCLQNYTTTGGLNHYAVVSNNDGPLYVLTSSGNDLLFRSGSDDFIWQNNSGGTEMRLDAGIISIATWEGVTVKEGFGGTAQSTYATGDMLYASATNTLSKLGAGSESEILTMVGGVPVWAPNVASGNSLTTGATVIGNTIYFDRNDALSAYTADLSGIVPTGLTTDNIDSGTTNFFLTDGDKGDITVSNSGATWTVNPSTLVYTTGSTIIGNTIYFDRTDVLSAYTADLTSIIPSFSGVTNGLTTYGSDIGLGGIFTQNTVISGGSQNLSLGVDASQLSSLNIRSIQGVEHYMSGGLGLILSKNPGTFNSTIDYNSVNGLKTTIQQNPDNVTLFSYGSSGSTFSYLQVKENIIQLSSVDNSVETMKFGLDRTNQLAVFTDSRTTTKGIEYAADYSTGYTPNSLITLRDLNLATTGLTDYYTTGTTLVGTTLYFDRTDTLSAYTADLSSIAGGGSGETNTASNVGGGEGLFSGKSGVDLQFKSLTSTGGTIAISSTGATVNLEASNTNDPNAIHDNVNSEISAITAKSALTDTDIFLIEDSSDSNSKKQTTLGDIKDAIGSATGGTPGIQTAVENFYIATANNQAATTGSQYSSKVIPLVNRTVSNMAYFVASASISRTVYVGIYDNAGNKLAEGSGNTDSTGIQTATLNTSVTLNANTEYFFSILEGSGVPNFAQTSTFGIDKLARSLFISTTPTGLAASISSHTAATSSFWLKAF